MVSLFKTGMKGVDCSVENSECDEVISDRLRVGISVMYLRKLLGLQQEDLAEKAGTTRKTVYELEHGDEDRNISKHMMLAIIAALLACEADESQTPDIDNELKFLRNFVNKEKLRSELQNYFFQIVRMTKDEFQHY